MPRTTNELFALFFDPKAPWAFVIGSLAIAVAGSALYSLLTTWLGGDVQTQLLLLASSLLVVLCAVFVLRQAVRLWAQHSSRGLLMVPEQERAPTYGGLVLPVGLNQHGPERAILEWHVRQGQLRYCWLLASAEASRSGKVSDLRQYLHEQNVVVHVIEIANAMRPFESYTAAMVALREARVLRGAWPVSMDITGGTATMSVGLALAAREQEVAIQYYPARFDRTGNIRPNSAEAPLLVALVAHPQEPT